MSSGPRSGRSSSRASWPRRWTSTARVSVSRTYVPNEYVVWLSPAGPPALRGRRAARSSTSSAPTCSSTPAASASRWSRGRRSSSAPTSAWRWASSASRRGTSSRAAERSRAPEARPADHGHTMVYSTADRAPGGAATRSARRADVRAARSSSPRASACAVAAGRRADRPQPRVRHRPRRLQRLAPPRRDRAGRRRRLDDRRPRLDQRRARQRPRVVDGPQPLDGGDQHRVRHRRRALRGRLMPCSSPSPSR